MERWLSWSKAHDWKSCNVSKAFWGSNPHLSAKMPGTEGSGFLFYFIVKEVLQDVKVYHCHAADDC